MSSVRIPSNSMENRNSPISDAHRRGTISMSHLLAIIRDVRRPMPLLPVNRPTSLVMELSMVGDGLHVESHRQRRHYRHYQQVNVRALPLIDRHRMVTSRRHFYVPKQIVLGNRVMRQRSLDYYTHRVASGYSSTGFGLRRPTRSQLQRYRLALIGHRLQIPRVYEQFDYDSDSEDWFGDEGLAAIPQSPKSRLAMEQWRSNRFGCANRFRSNLQWLSVDWSLALSMLISIGLQGILKTIFNEVFYMD